MQKCLASLTLLEVCKRGKLGLVFYIYMGQAQRVRGREPCRGEAVVNWGIGLPTVHTSRGHSRGGVPAGQSVVAAGRAVYLPGHGLAVGRSALRL